MIYVLKKEGEKQIEISFPVQKENHWIVYQDDFEFHESTSYTFDTENQAKLFLECHIHSFEIDGYEISQQSPLTDD